MGFIKLTDKEIGSKPVASTKFVVTQPENIDGVQKESVRRVGLTEIVNLVLSAGVAAEFSTSTAYSSGDYVVYQGELYRFKATHAAGDWNTAHVNKVVLMDEIQSALGTDKTLTEENVPADAKKVGDEISDLKDALSDLGNVQFTLGEWEEGSFNNQNGNVTDFAGFIRPKFYFSYTENGIKEITINDGYLAIVYAWNISDGSFVGVGKSGGIFSTGDGAIGFNNLNLENYPNYKFKMGLRKDPVTTDISLNDGLNCIFVSKTDMSLSNGGAPADAKVVGEAVVRFDVEQDKSEEEKARARENLGINDTSGLTEEAKQALLACFENVAWINQNGQLLLDALEVALYQSQNWVDVTNSLENWYNGPSGTSYTTNKSANGVTFSSGASASWSIYLLQKPATIRTSELDGKKVKIEFDAEVTGVPSGLGLNYSIASFNTQTPSGNSRTKYPAGQYAKESGHFAVIFDISSDVIDIASDRYFGATLYWNGGNNSSITISNFHIYHN